MTSRLAKLSPAEAVSLAMRMVDELPDSTVALVVKAIAARVCMNCGHKGPCRCGDRGAIGHQTYQAAWPGIGR